VPVGRAVLPDPTGRRRSTIPDPPAHTAPRYAAGRRKGKHALLLGGIGIVGIPVVVLAVMAIAFFVRRV
jgi:hypothetical protein